MKSASLLMLNATCSRRGLENTTKSIVIDRAAIVGRYCLSARTAVIRGADSAASPALANDSAPLSLPVKRLRRQDVRVRVRRDDTAATVGKIFFPTFSRQSTTREGGDVTRVTPPISRKNRGAFEINTSAMYVACTIYSGSASCRIFVDNRGAHRG